MFTVSIVHDVEVINSPPVEAKGEMILCPDIEQSALKRLRNARLCMFNRFALP